MILVAIIAIVLLAAAGVLVTSALLEPRLRRTQNLSGIDAYGYTGRLDRVPRQKDRPKRKMFDELASSLGNFVAGKLSVRDEDLQRELISAGFFNVGVRRFLGYRAMLAVALPVLFVWFGVLGHFPTLLLVVAVVVSAVAGWMGPLFVVHRRSRLRLAVVDEALPGLIDLLVVTLEAGVSFAGALHMSADRLGGPLGEEIRLTIQEQSLGLSSFDALENWQRRCDTPAVRSFVRSMVQGNRLGVSIGQILRNQAIEMRARQKALVEERAQKAPVKILFPLVFLIFPSMFVIILGPALFTIAKSLGG